MKIKLVNLKQNNRYEQGWRLIFIDEQNENGFGNPFIKESNSIIKYDKWIAGEYLPTFNTERRSFIVSRINAIAKRKENVILATNDDITKSHGNVLIQKIMEKLQVNV